MSTWWVVDTRKNRPLSRVSGTSIVSHEWFSGGSVEEMPTGAPTWPSVVGSVQMRHRWTQTRGLDGEPSVSETGVAVENIDYAPGRSSMDGLERPPPMASVEEEAEELALHNELDTHKPRTSRAELIVAHVDV